MNSNGTIWVCQDCIMHAANGECGSCHDSEGHDCEPLSLTDPRTTVPGMAREEHAEDCPRRNGDDSTDCDCETDTYSTSQCEGCGSYLHGERHAMTILEDTPPQSGTSTCACRDCFEIIMARNVARPELCEDCHTAGCGDPNGSMECQREDAYNG